MFGELIAMLNALIAAARIPLTRKEKKLVDTKLHEASQIIQKASERDIELYDPKLRKLRDRIDYEHRHRDLLKKKKKKKKKKK